MKLIILTPEKLQELLRKSFEAGGNNKMKPFSTDLCGIDCPDFDEWVKNKLPEAKEIESEFLSCWNAAIYFSNKKYADVRPDFRIWFTNWLKTWFGIK